MYVMYSCAVSRICNIFTSELPSGQGKEWNKIYNIYQRKMNKLLKLNIDFPGTGKFIWCIDKKLHCGVLGTCATQIVVLGPISPRSLLEMW